MRAHNYNWTVARMSDGNYGRAEPAPTAETRRHKRGEVDIFIEIREHGAGRHKGRLTDLSQSGCRISCPVFIPENRKVSITIPGFSPLEAEIVWKIGDDYGCSFANPLYEAVYDHIVAKYPSLGRLS